MPVRKQPAATVGSTEHHLDAPYVATHPQAHKPHRDDLESRYKSIGIAAVSGACTASKRKQTER